MIDHDIELSEYNSSPRGLGMSRLYSHRYISIMLYAPMQTNETIRTVKTLFPVLWKSHGFRSIPPGVSNKASTFIPNHPIIASYSIITTAAQAA